jgi:adenine C2-methylase RlmN of 23S rRNA A2503 and tRNA A37
METFRSDNNTVGKYVHDDFSETAIKNVSSCDTILDPVTGKFYPNNVDRRKYSIFISSSVGCFMKCKFCYLTIKNSPYKKITKEQLRSNIEEAIIEEIQQNPDNANRYVKVCFMGQGEDHMVDPVRTREYTNELLDYLLVNNLALGLDGVDIATVMSKGTCLDWINEFTLLNESLSKYNMNPNNIKTVNASNAYNMDNQRSRLRLFYSLHSAIQSEREMLIPNAMPLITATQELDKFHNQSGCNIIFHHMFMEGQNDSDRSVDALLEFMSTRKQHELRILRYNSCYYTPFGESKRFDEIVARISKEIPRIKIQISVGTEVAAACGQFIVKSWADPNFNRE